MAAPIIVAGAATIGLITVLMYASSGGVGGGAVGAAGGCSTTTQAGTANIATLDAQQLANAGTIVAVGKAANIPAYGWVIAIATAMQESTLRNVNFGDRDSLGLFQQRAPWGTAEQRTDPATAARLFYDRLITIPAWASMPLTVAAQAVQASGFPNAYAQWQPLAMRVGWCRGGGVRIGRPEVRPVPGVQG